jgi:hypothetical protein
MESRPTFFIPGVDETKHDECYQELARAISVPAAPLGQRVYSITFRHNGEVWTATVGKELTGYAEKKVRVRGRMTERTVQLSNPSTVMAIYEGSPFYVWHDNKSKTWANPFLAGEPISITRFAA